MKRILVTGFEPFSDFQTNPSETLVSDLALQLQKQNQIEVGKLILPVDYQKASSVLDTIDFGKFDFIFQFGVAAQRTRVCLERVALNWIEASIPDNSGKHPNCRAIDDGMDSAKISSMDLQKIVSKLNSEFPDAIEVSFSAGAYLCNYVYFKTLSRTSKCLFVHIPAELKYQNQAWNHETDFYRSTLTEIGFRLVESILE